MKYYFFIGLAAFTILSQVPHAYYVFSSFSRLKDNARALQASSFCIILSLGIFGFVWIDKPMLALFGAVLEMVINIYYYTTEFWNDGFGKKHRGRSIGRFWRQNWIKLLISVVIPMFIYIFSEIIVSL
jgi:hypothetical protein